MTTFTDVEAKKQLEAVLERASSEGEVRIRRGDGREFILRPARTSPSTIDAGFVDVRPTAEEIVDAVRLGRERGVGGL